MSETENLQVGDPVYRPYKPAQYGVIIERDEKHTEHGPFDNFIRKPEGAPPNEPRLFYKVLWRDGSEDWNWYLHVKSYDALVRANERKAATARKQAGKARKLHPMLSDERLAEGLKNK